MYSIDLVKIPEGWAAHCRQERTGASAADKKNALAALKSRLLRTKLEDGDATIHIFSLPDPGHYSFKNISNSAPAHIKSGNTVLDGPD